MASDKWFAVALPVLEELAAIEDTDALIAIGDLAERTGVTPAAVSAELDRLVGSGYIDGEITRTMGPVEGHRLHSFVLSERGARAVEVWPNADPFDTLLALLDQRLLDQALDEETRSRLATLRSTLTDIGKGAAGGVLAALVRSGIGMV